MKKIIIIGGGIAGLTAGIYAKLYGYDVEIYEKNPSAGGFLTSWYRRGNVIDGCLHWMIGTKDGSRLNKIWKTNGGLDGVEIIHPNSFYEVVFEGEKLTFYRDVDKLRAELIRHCASENDERWARDFIDAIVEMGEAVMPCEIPFELNTKPTPPKMSLMRKLRPFLSLNVEDLAQKFDSPILQYAFLNGLVDKKFSSHYLLQMFSNFVIGNASLPVGGSHQIRDNLVRKFISLGGKIFYRADVEEIVIQGNLAKGILVNGERKSADYVIPACDTHYTFHTLLKGAFGDPYEAFDENKTEYPTYSFIAASYRTKHSFKNSEIATVYKVDEYTLCNTTFDVLPVRHYGYVDEFIHDGYTTVSVLLPTYEEDYEYVKNLSKDEYKTFKAHFGQLFKKKLEEVYQDEFELIDTLTPLTYERYNHAYKGSFMTYALQSRKPQLLHSMLIEGLNNVVLANQWLMMPGGTPIAVIVGKFAMQHVLHKDGKPYEIE